MREQATLAMENLKKTLEAARCSLRDVVSATRYLTDVSEQDDLNRVWAAYLGDHLPTTTTVEVSRLATHARCKLEISAIAVADSAIPRTRKRARPVGGVRRPSRSPRR
jgi:enamine deaminase RidA (YjgF/YER057c/UK114 family)